jgi:hypothetical protein
MWKSTHLFRLILALGCASALIFASCMDLEQVAANRTEESPSWSESRFSPNLNGYGITDPDLVVPQPPLSEPGVNIPATDPAFGTTLRRLSDTSENGGYETHLYSQLQAFSADNAYVLLADADKYLVRRMDDLSPVAGLNTSGWNAPRWQPALAHTLVHYDTNANTTVRVQYTNVDTGQTTTVFTFPAAYDYIRSNQSFDELSLDGRWMAGMAQRNDGEQVIFALDLQNKSLGATLALTDLYNDPCDPDPTWGILEPDWVGVSPLGNYLVIQWPRDGEERCSGLETFNLANGAFVGRVYDGHQHGDLGLLTDGVTEMFMTFELYHPSGQLAIGYRLLPGTSTSSPPVYLLTMDWIAAHISCQGPAGVCLVTTDADPSNGWQALEGEIFLLYTDGAVDRLAHHRSSACGYWVQPRGSLSADGRLAIFTTDWGANSCAGGFDLGAGNPYTVSLGASRKFSSQPARDGWILESSETSAEGGSLNQTATTLKVGDDSNDRQYRAILSFDTTLLPNNAVIMRVTLKIRKQGQVGTDAFNTHIKLLVDIREGAFGNDNLLQIRDFQAGANRYAAAVVPKKKVNNWYSVELPSSAFAFVNKNGLTQFRLRFAKDDNNNNSADYINFFSGNALIANRPQLIIEYYVP